jgi:hypothetical protein
MMEDNRSLVDSLGSIITVAGTGEGPGGSAGRGDGSSRSSSVNTPEDVAVAPDGTMYVSDLARTIRVTREPY